MKMHLAAFLATSFWVLYTPTVRASEESVDEARARLKPYVDAAFLACQKAPVRGFGTCASEELRKALPWSSSTRDYVVAMSSMNAANEERLNGAKEKLQRYVDATLKACPSNEAETFEKCSDAALAKVLPSDLSQADRDLATSEASNAMAARVEAARELAVAKVKAACARQRIKEGTVRIGMTAQMAVECGWGKPETINRTTTARGTTEQWVYDGAYLYFTNGVLTAVQD